jgi:hypothetical protein
MTPAVTPQAPAPAPTQAPVQAQGPSVPMQFRDGSQSMVPKEKVVDAMYDGGELLHPMKFPDGSQAMVAHSKLAGAMGDGGQRLDTKPLPAATWQQYLGSAFGTMDPSNTPGQETGIPSTGQQMTKGLTQASSGQPLAGAANIGESLVDTTAGMGGPSAVGLQSERALAKQAAEKVAEDLPAPSMKNLYKIIRDANLESEISTGTSTAAASQKVADTAYKGAAEARQAGNSAKAIAYDSAAMAAKAYGKYSMAKAAVLKTVPFAGGAALAYEMYEHYAGMHDIYKGVHDFVLGSDKDDARDTLFGKD